MTIKHPFRFLVLVLACFACSCAAIQPPDVGGPRSMGPLYPIVFTEQAQRQDASILAFNRLTQTSNSVQLQLQPITGALESLPANLGTPLYLPKVGVNPEMNEEETRVSLRRFVTDWQVLIGADPADLSLVERTDRPDGLKIAKYQQKRFRFPLRGGYGSLEIQFLPNRVVRNLSSTCIPDAGRLQVALAQIAPKLTAADAIKSVQGADIIYTSANGQSVTSRVSTNEEVTPVELVTLVSPTVGRTDALELHLAWEVSVGSNPRRLVYVDALEGNILKAVAA